MCVRLWLSLLLLATAPLFAQDDRSRISKAATTATQKYLVELEADWFQHFVSSGNCDYMGPNHPDWYDCVAMIGAWNNSKDDPQLFGPFKEHVHVFSHVLNTTIEDVSIAGSSATARVLASATCGVTDLTRGCDRRGTIVRVHATTKLIGYSLLIRQWQAIDVILDSVPSPRPGTGNGVKGKTGVSKTGPKTPNADNF